MRLILAALVLTLFAGCGGGKLSQDDRVRWDRYRKLHPNEYKVLAYGVLDGESEKKWGSVEVGRRIGDMLPGRSRSEKDILLDGAQELSLDTQAHAVIDMTSQPDPQVVKWFFWEGTDVKSGDSPPDPTLERSLRAYLLVLQRNAK
jgi:hypothetical protein